MLRKKNFNSISVDESPLGFFYTLLESIRPTVPNFVTIELSVHRGSVICMKKNIVSSDPGLPYDSRVCAMYSLLIP